MNRRRLLLPVVVAAVGTALLAPNAAADAPGAVGWWTQRAGALPSGAGGVEIATSVRGDESVAAVRVDALPGGILPDRIVLTQTATPATGTVAFHACPATSDWEPTDAGAFEEQPTADCATSVDAVPTGEGRWTVPLGGLLADDGTADVVLLPTNAELVPGVPGLGFTVAFGSVEVFAAGAGGTEATTTVPPTTETAAPTGGGGGGSGGAAPRPSSPVVRPAPVPAGVPTTVVGIGSDGSGGSLAAPVAPGATVPAPLFDLASSHDQRPWARLLLLVPLSAVVGFAAASGRRLARERGLGAASVA